MRLEWKLSWSKVSDPISLINDTHTPFNEEKGTIMVVVVVVMGMVFLFFVLYLFLVFFFFYYIYILQGDIVPVTTILQPFFCRTIFAVLTRGYKTVPSDSSVKNTNVPQ